MPKRKVWLFVLPVLTIVAIMSFLLANIPLNAAVNWQLVWSDEFDGSAISTSNWTYDTGGSGWGNNELEYYTNRSENARTESGNLIIEACKESYNGMNYTSARLKSQGLKSWTYGKIDARIKIPTGQGIWPAFWMLGSNIPQVNWPGCGEIDVMEHINNESAVHGTIHWDLNGHQYYGGTSPNLDVTQYHNYTIEWDSSSIKWFIDGSQYCGANILDNINGTDEFHKPFFILLNLAVGGDWPGSPDSNTVFPAKMYVDYVRVYQQGSASLTPTITSTPTATQTPTPTSVNTPTPTGSTTTDFSQSIASSGSSQAIVQFIPTVTSDYVILHYTIGNTVQQNVYMSDNGGKWQYTISNLSSKSQINYSFTYTKSGLQYDSPSYIYIHNPVSPTPTQTILIGDVNFDGQVNIIDALLLAQYTVSIQPPLDSQTAFAADVNKDGTINIVDALRIAQYSVGLITGF